MDAAEKFVAFWVAQFNEALRTADSASIAAISTAECPACQRLIQEIEDVRRDGRHVDGDLWAISSSYIGSFDGSANAVVFTTIQQKAVPLLNASGSVVKTYPNETLEFGFTLTHDGSTWRVSRLQSVAK